MYHGANYVVLLIWLGICALGNWFFELWVWGWGDDIAFSIAAFIHDTAVVYKFHLPFGFHGIMDFIFKDLPQYIFYTWVGLSCLISLMNVAIVRRENGMNELEEWGGPR